MFDVYGALSSDAFIHECGDMRIFFLRADSGKRKKKGNEMEQIDCTPPEHILPGSKERPLVPLQPQNKDWKVRSSVVLENI